MTSTDVNTKVECTQPLIKTHGDMRWRQMGNTMHVNTNRRRNISLAISGDGNRVVLGTRGKGLVFDFDGTSWSKAARFTIFSESRFTSFSLSRDGKTLAFGARHSKRVSLTERVEFNSIEILQYKEERRWKRAWIGNVSVRELMSVSLSGNGSRIAIDGKWPREIKIFEFVSDEILKEIWQKYAGSSDWSTLVKEFLGDRCQQIGQTIITEQKKDFWSIDNVSLSSDGNVVAVAQRLEHRHKIERKDTVRVFRYSSGQGQWIKVGQELYGNAQFFIGDSISLNAKGNIMVFSAYGDNHYYVQVYSFNGHQWNKISNISTEYPFRSLSLSSSGNTIAVDFFRTKYALTFKYNGNDWVPMKICGQPEDHANSVSLSSDGNRLTVASSFNNYAQLKVYEFVSST